MKNQLLILPVTTKKLTTQKKNEFTKLFRYGIMILI